MKLNDLSKEQLIEMVKQLKQRKKFGLVWEDKPENVVEQCKKELPVLEEVKDKEVISDENLPVNILIEGDNYHALSVLNYTHAGRIDVIYIDPPYNTGNKDFKYNDEFVEKEDSYRHSKWLSFMEKRLQASRRLMRNSGVILLSIDDNEQAGLKLLCDEVFGEENFIADFIVVRAEGGGLAKQAVIGHDYLLAYAKDIKHFSPLGRPKDIRGKIVEMNGESYWIETDWLRKEFGKYGTCLYEEIEKIKGKEKKDEIDNGLREGKYVLIEKGNSHIVGRYRKISEDTSKFYTILKHLNKNGVHDLRKLNIDFDFPKPLSLLKEIILGATIRTKDGLILDFFAGSGTTGHAVLELNKEDGGNRKFILCTNNENGIAEEVCYPRVKKVIEGYSDVKGIPANIKYFKTSFVKKSTVTDDTRELLVKKSVEMICVKEGTFNEVVNNADFKVYKDGKHSTGILFNLEKITGLKEALQALKMPSNIYVFSLSNDTYNSDFEDLTVKHKLCPIPESILEVYRKLFKE